MYCVDCYKKLEKQRRDLSDCLSCMIKKWFDNIRE